MHGEGYVNGHEDRHGDAQGDRHKGGDDQGGDW